MRFEGSFLWEAEDRQTAENEALQEDEKLRIDLSGLFDFCRLFSDLLNCNGLHTQAVKAFSNT